MRTKSPRILTILCVAAISLFVACGSEDDNDEEDTSTGDDAGTTTGGDTGEDPVSFAALNTIFEDKCGGSTCHSSGASNTQYIDAQSAVDGNAASIADRVEDDSMPQAGSPPLTATEKATVLRYLRAQ